MTIKRYEYVDIHMSGFFGAGQKEHREIIDRYAAKGYRYVGYVPVCIDMDGRLTDRDLVFEIDC